jgi:hypothetical protein
MVLRTGTAWAHLPHDFPPYGTVHRWFLRLARTGTFERMMHALAMVDRERAGRGAAPTAVVMDAQTARASTAGSGPGAAMTPRRAPSGAALVDTDGRLLLAAISPASLHDSHGGVALLATSRMPWPFLTRCFADRAYAGQRVATASSVSVSPVGSPPGQRASPCTSLLGP